MYNIDDYLNNIESSIGKIKRELFKEIFSGFEAIKSDLTEMRDLISNNQTQINEVDIKYIRCLDILNEQLVKTETSVRNLNNRFETDFETVCINVRNLNEWMKEMLSWQQQINSKHANLQEEKIDFEQDFETVCVNVRNLNEWMKGISSWQQQINSMHVILQEEKLQSVQDFENLSINMRHNNEYIEKIQSDLALIKAKLYGMQREKQIIKEADECREDNECKSIIKEEIETRHKIESDYEEIDYFDFENHFRGSMEQIKNSQRQYLRYFENKTNVVDIGCGRGEFLVLMNDNNINALGIDVYQPYVDYCNMSGLHAICMDGIDYLTKTDNKVDGIFVGQVVEHLLPGKIIKLCEMAYNKLEKDGCIVIETPNPTSLAIYTNAFYIDPSHQKPVHPLTMKYYLEKSGFRNIEIVYTKNSVPQDSIPILRSSEAIENIEEFNKAIQRVSEIMFGSQDYAIIAVK